MRIAIPRLREWASRVLHAGGLQPQQAEEVAALMVRTDARGYRTHGLTRLPSYVERLETGDFNAQPAMRHRAFGGGVTLDADGAMGHVAAPYAIELGLARLRTQASVLVTLRSCGHLGALGIHALHAAEAGAFCLVGQTTPPVLAMPGFAGAAMGLNPLAYACPVPGGAPIVFDMSCSVAARGHVLQAARDGRPIPSDWALDAQGQPTTDPQEALRGALQPAGGHKGIGLALLVQCLGGALCAQAGERGERAVVQVSGAPGRQDAFVWLVQPGAFTDDASFAGAMTALVRDYHARGGKAARLPGERGRALESECQRHGVSYEGAARTELVALGERLGIPFPRHEG